MTVNSTSHPLVVGEGYVGTRPKEITQIETLFSYSKSLTIEDEIGVLTRNYANEFQKTFNGISLEDFMVTTTEKHYNLTLWIYNKNYYSMRGYCFYLK